MGFNQLILTKLRHIIQENNLYVAEERNDYIKLEKGSLFIIISHNPLENSNTLWLGQNDNQLDVIEIDNYALRTFFQSNLRFNEICTDSFISNLVQFFENQANSLLKGDLSILVKLKEFDQIRSDSYTQSLLESQNLVKADKAWQEENYEEFIKFIDRIGVEKLLTSYKLKYKIALKKL